MAAKHWLIVFISSICVTGSVFLFNYVLLDDIVNYEIGQEFALKNGSDAFNRWVDTPIPIYLKVYLFNVTNVEEVVKGGKPKLKEQGPYIYRELRKKKIINYNNGKDTISYNQEVVFYFDKEKSGNYSDHDVITVINPAILSITRTLERIPPVQLLSKFLGFAISSMFGSPSSVFLTTSVKKLLFDGEPITCSQKNPNLETLFVCSSLQNMLPIPVVQATKNGDMSFAMLRHEKDCGFDLKVDLLGRKPLLINNWISFGGSHINYYLDASTICGTQKNGSGMGEFEVNAGIKDPKKLGLIESWNKQDTLKMWPGKPCNILTGNDMTLITPYRNKNSKLKIFSTDICSTVSLVYNNEMNFKGIPGLQFVPPSSFLGEVLEFPENSCYCGSTIKGLTEPSPCLQRGALDISSCLGVPAILTKPHFLDAASEYLEAVDGLQPDPQKHLSFLNIEPRTGVPLQGFQRIQINIQVEAMMTVGIMRNLPKVLFPIMWIEEGSELDNSNVDLLNQKLLGKLHLVDVIKWPLLIICILADLFSLYMFLRSCWKKKKLSEE